MWTNPISLTLQMTYAVKSDTGYNLDKPDVSGVMLKQEESQSQSETRPHVHLSSPATSALRTSASTTHIRPLALSQIQVGASCLYVRERVSAHAAQQLLPSRVENSGCCLISSPAVWNEDIVFSCGRWELNPELHFFSSPKSATCNQLQDGELYPWLQRIGFETDEEPELCWPCRARLHHIKHRLPHVTL